MYTAFRSESKDTTSRPANCRVWEQTPEQDLVYDTGLSDASWGCQNRAEEGQMMAAGEKANNSRKSLFDFINNESPLQSSRSWPSVRGVEPASSRLMLRTPQFWYLKPRNFLGKLRVDCGLTIQTTIEQQVQAVFTGYEYVLYWTHMQGYRYIGTGICIREFENEVVNI